MVTSIDVTQAQFFIPEIWAQRAIEILRSQIVATPRILRDTDVAAFSVGDILHIPYPGILVSNNKAAQTDYSFQAPSGETEVQLTLNKHKEATFLVEDIVRAQQNQSVMDRYSEAAAIALAEAVETDVVTELQSATNTDGTSSYGTDLSAAELRAAWKAMTDNKAPQSDRFALISTQDYITLLDDVDLQNYFAFSRPQAVSGAGGEMAGQALGNLYGFDVFSSQFIALAGASQTGVTSANATDIITKAGHGFAANDVVEFTALTGGAGLVVGTQYFVIATNLTANDFMVSATKGGATVNHTTDITAGTVRTISRKNVAWRRDGAIAAFRGMPEPPPGSGAVSANVADPQSGVVLRVLMAYDNRAGGVQVTHEVLYGVKKLQEEKLLLIKS